MNSKSCLVTGATGVVGVPLVRELLRQDYRVRILARSSDAGKLFPAAVEVVTGDVNDQSALEKCVAGVDTVFHLAAKLHINNPNSELDRKYIKTNVEATIELLKLAKLNAVKQFVFASTINVYGAGDGVCTFDETSPINPLGIYAQTKAEAEAAVLSEDFAVVLRLAAVYGSGMKGNYVRVLKAVRSKRFFFVGDALNRRTLIHHDDAARALILAAEKAAGKSLYNATDGGFYSFQQIVLAIAQAVEVKIPTRRVPLAPVERIIDFVEIVERLSKIKFKINRQTLEKLLEDVAVDGTKIKRELGFKPEFDLIRGWQEAVEPRMS